MLAGCRVARRHGGAVESFVSRSITPQPHPNGSTQGRKETETRGTPCTVATWRLALGPSGAIEGRAIRTTGSTPGTSSDPCLARDDGRWLSSQSIRVRNLDSHHPTPSIQHPIHNYTQYPTPITQHPTPNTQHPYSYSRPVNPRALPDSIRARSPTERSRRSSFAIAFSGRRSGCPDPNTNRSAPMVVSSVSR